MLLPAAAGRAVVRRGAFCCPRPPRRFGARPQSSYSRTRPAAPAARFAARPAPAGARRCSPRPPLAVSARPRSSEAMGGSAGSTGQAAPDGARGSAWVGVDGPGSRDLRSDVVTTPTPSMLAAVQSCSLLDDVFGEDPTTSRLEAHVAALAGKEAGLFVLSGTMGNQLALRSLLVQPPHGVLCDHRSHIIQHEAGGVSSLTGATVQPVVPGNGTHLTLQDISAHAVLGDDVHVCPTRVISLENTLHGLIMPLGETRLIADFARRHGIRLHCDGARLWEAVAAGAATLPDFCSLFDTVSLCFSKGLGAPVGSILVGSRETLRHARWVRKSLGGGMRQPGVVTAAARVAVDETFGRTPDGRDGLLRASHDMAKGVEALWTAMGGAVVHPVQTNMCWLDLAAARCSERRFVELGAAAGLRLSGGRLVTHYQIAQNADDVLARLRRVFHGVFAANDGPEGAAAATATTTTTTDQTS